VPNYVLFNYYCFNNLFAKDWYGMNMKRWREPSQKGAARRAENNFKAPLKGEDCGN